MKNFAGIVPGMRDFSYKNSLEKLDLFSFEIKVERKCDRGVQNCDLLGYNKYMVCSLNRKTRFKLISKNFRGGVGKIMLVL